MSNTKAELVVDRLEDFPPYGLAYLKIWLVPKPVPGCAHAYKYRLAYVFKGECVLRYDNERGKGDHRHFVKSETPYAFSSVKQLMADFRVDVNIWNRWRMK